MLHFIKASTSEPAIAYLVRTLTRRLQAGDRVLWLVSGGSSILLVVQVASRLRAASSDDGAGLHLDHLTLTLTDERYGSVGHADSNWQQLLDAGLNLPHARLLPVLTDADTPGDTHRAATAKQWNDALTRARAQADYALGFFGIGPDGHTSGILPHSPAVTATTSAFAYTSAAVPGSRPPFPRITTTPAFIKQLDEAVVYMTGEAKRPIIDQLATDLPVADQPSQILKTIPTLTIFNDYKGAPA